ncbi:phosphoribosylformylglycinamidine synthase [Pseudoflavonifractor sp. An184]|uniref:phosphoribosylformylglycinamidine synthase n=1 Tax=Pseudoflavonifractor sp. An184 TaxID=1965576 RepID=UPI000B382D0F|nr:phosphoribosylformylglycinamidine synthase [Pseudoflavonifractor sp. An184]OUP52048.1 phosphoribosylformylglycinamidine synthase [Pseudoflavonifractor sp. An184]
MSVFRCYSEKKPGFDVEARGLCGQLREQLGIDALEGVRILNRYDADRIAPEVYEAAKTVVFSEPQVDDVYDETFPVPEAPHSVLAVEALPGQFDQRADSCAQCIQLQSGVDRPLIAAAKVYLLMGTLTEGDLDKIRRYLINPVESREASMDKPATLEQEHETPDSVTVVEGFIGLDEAGLKDLLDSLGLAMDLDDLKFLQAYFRDQEKRDPTITEVRVVDTYWSDHCRHTTFSTHLDDIQIDDPEVKAAYEQYLAARVEVYGEEKAKKRPQTLMDLATIGAKTLKKRGQLPELDESEEINACSIHVPAQVDGQEQDWLLMFKNETHNHPTEIEPFGGAATCIGGCIRDPLSGRVFVHQAMRVTGGGDPRVPLSQTTPGKLPQRKLATTAAAGYSSYGNQIGLATGHVAEVYHPGYIAKRLECGAVVGAAPAENVRRERPAPGDVVILLGGRTGRDGIGGATGSSKSHNQKSLTTMASEVQKGNAPEERKIQRLFRRGEVTRLIKRCNDFGAGGVSVAIGELADGLSIDLDAVRKKYEGLDGTELAISESQERMAVVVAPEDAEKFIAAAQEENLEAYQVAVVTESPRMVMTWKGQTIANLSREFLNTNGAVKHAGVSVPKLAGGGVERPSSLKEMAASLKSASRRGLTERFDGSIGAGSVLMPFGGRTQRTPAQAMAALLPVLPGQETDQASVMAWGFDPDQMMEDPFFGAYCSVVASLAKVAAAGGDYKKAYLTFQEFFEKLRSEPERWGKPFAALLGALKAQLDFGRAAIGGKDSMSGSFNDLDVPPTLISFAIAPIKAGEVLSPEFKEAGHPVYRFAPENDSAQALKTAWEAFYDLHRQGKVKAAWAVENSLAEAVMKMSFGNSIGFQTGLEDVNWYAPCAGAIVAELTEEINLDCARRIGETTEAPFVALPGDAVSIQELLQLNEDVLEKVYPTRAGTTEAVEPISWDKRSIAVCKHKVARPKAVIPVFPGTNCEYDTAQACLRAGIEPEIIVIRNLSTDLLAQSAQALEKAIRSAQMVVLPGGFSGGDEPDGSGKFIASFLRSPALSDAVMDLLKNRDGLMLGICNGFQALVKLGLVPYGEIRDMDADCPTLTYNLIGRHQSSYVTTRVASVNSPWMLKSQVGDLHTIPISHGEGRFVAPAQVIAELIAHGQVATQYVNAAGQPTMDIDANPNGSMEAIEGIFSPDGRVFGKMGHLERRGPFVGVNIPGNKHQPLFESGAEYFR